MADKTKFAAFVAEKKLNAARLIAVSSRLEKTAAEAAKAEAAAKPAEATEKKDDEKHRKFRSFRSVTPRAFSAAMTGGTLSGPTKQRILRAVNFLLEQKKAEKVELKTLF